ncbi:MAG: hypothetical protein HYX61_00505 [Gammaproteobacteria bacterium]|nr:hypothetical protein [Gammaproteobacteria bacterium]
MMSIRSTQDTRRWTIITADYSKMSTKHFILEEDRASSLPSWIFFIHIKQYTSKIT